VVSPSRESAAIVISSEVIVIPSSASLGTEIVFSSIAPSISLAILSAISEAYSGFKPSDCKFERSASALILPVLEFIAFYTYCDKSILPKESWNYLIKASPVNGLPFSSCQLTLIGIYIPFSSRNFSKSV